MRVLTILCVGMVTCGCHAEPGGDPPAKLGMERRGGPVPARLEPGTFKLTFDEPKDGDYPSGEPIPCVVTLQLEPGGETSLHGPASASAGEVHRRE